MALYTPYINQEKIKVTEDSRFDLLKNKYQKYWIHETEILRQKYKKFILINTTTLETQ